jgi:hypothetical protein
MSLRPAPSILAVASALSLALLSAPAFAEQANSGPVPAPPPVSGPGVAPPPGMPDTRPVWQGPASVMPDPRTRDAWLRECYRRTDYYYGGYDGWREGRRKHRRHRDDRYDRGPAYGYCEAYFDDWYRTGGYGHAHAYAVPMMTYAMPMAYAAAPVAQPSQNCVETVTTEYVPVRRRVIHRRPAPRAVPDKRVRIVPDKRLPAD